MQPNNPVPGTIVGQAAQSMAQNQPELNQMSSSSPAFQPDLQTPPNSAMPSKTPMSLIHKNILSRYLARNQNTPQLAQPPMGQSVSQPTTQTPPAMTDAEKILSAMDTHLKHKDKIEAKHAGLVEKLIQSIFPTQGPTINQNDEEVTAGLAGNPMKGPMAYQPGTPATIPSSGGWNSGMSPDDVKKN